ncbi:hypothetical protein E0493_20570 [Roseomonas sp. M0104]|uniref:Uncharacterized protein n=1 Tax=Teichococcus coralli TaxID=2545983 RepID=A0A845BFU7_9PROT|nr:hypothetical protein [Pseudoroseomonas coralli]MXP65748.1 hypothetical protein [Pseudoroseomonas coralli]
MGLQAEAARCGLALGALFLLAGCVGAAEAPGRFLDRAFGTPLDGRPPPPGSGEPYPNLASVPPAPPRGSPSEREALTSRLSAARAASREPVTPGGPLPAPPAGVEGAGRVPLRPPSAPRLAAAPRVRPDAPLAAPSPGPAGEAPGAAPALPADPGAPPAPPPAEFLATPPPRL